MAEKLDLGAGADLRWVYDPDPAKVILFQERYFGRAFASTPRVAARSDASNPPSSEEACERGPLSLRP
jgi:hypothetical protein